MATTLISSILRSETYPKEIQISASKNKAYLSLTVNNWTEKMFYELPYVKFDVYTKSGTTDLRYLTASKTIPTYNPIFPLSVGMSISFELVDIPASCYLHIMPVFDDDSIAARNALIANGIEDGTEWDTLTDSFDITITYSAE